MRIPLCLVISRMQPDIVMFASRQLVLMIEKFIFIPDTTNGNFDTFKNRNRFFNNEIKLNEELLRLISDFWKKMEMTIDKLK